MFVIMSCDIVVWLYDEICKLWLVWYDEDDVQGVIKVVMIGGLNDFEYMMWYLWSKVQ